ncbi:FxsA family protein [Candidatus Bipolaricaulota bacterium]
MPLITFVLLAAEIALLIKLSQAVGGGLVLLEILGSAVLGVLLLRASGRKLFDTRQLIGLLSHRPNLHSRRPILSLVYGALLLLVPGLLTDLAGVVLVARYLLLGGRGSTSSGGSGPSDSIDVDFEVQDEASGQGPEDAE